MALGGCISFAGGSVEIDKDIKKLLETKDSSSQVGQLMSNYTGAEARKKKSLEQAEKAYEEAKKKAEQEWQSNRQGSLDQLYSLMDTYRQNIVKLKTHQPYLVLQTRYFGIQGQIRALEQQNIEYSGIGSEESKEEIEANNKKIKKLSESTESLVETLQKRDKAIRQYAAMIRVGLETLKKMSPAEYEAKKAPYEALLSEMEAFLASSPSKPAQYKPAQASQQQEPKTDDERQKRLDELAKRFRPVYEQQK
ncbi:hypothetical protein GF371_02840 [Candidatus Woesearchaeota archaeon]|nr:hypothetical protein [Candidatus Woesearchaeota archaeon]